MQVYRYCFPLGVSLHKTAVQPTSFMVPTQGGYQIATAPKEDGAQGGGASAMETD